MLKRDPKTIASKINITKDGIFCTENCIIEFPKWYQDRGLVSVENDVKVYGIFAIIIGDKYSVSLIPTLCSCNPISMTEVEREDGQVYMQLLFAKGDKIIESQTVVKQTRMTVILFEALYIAAKMPWFIEYEDAIKILDNTGKYAGSGVGGNHISNEIVVSFICRDKRDKSVYFRQTEQKEHKAWVDLLNPFYAINNNVNKIAGGYLNDNMVSAIINTNKESTRLEQLVRS